MKVLETIGITSFQGGCLHSIIYKSTFLKKSSPERAATLPGDSNNVLDDAVKKNLLYHSSTHRNKLTVKGNPGMEAVVMTIMTNIGNFGNWFSVKCEMENTGVKSVKVEDCLCIANIIHLGGILGELTLTEVKELADNEYR